MLSVQLPITYITHRVIITAQHTYRLIHSTILFHFFKRIIPEIPMTDFV